MLANTLSMSVLLLCCTVIAFPGVSVRAVVIAAVVASSLDVYAGMIAGSGGGVTNALKLGAIAFLLYLKTRHLPAPAVPRAVAILWVLFCGYASVTLLWSEFVFAGLKQIGYFVAYTLVTLSLYRVLLHYGLRVYRWLAVALLAALVLGAVQTWLLGNPFGEWDHRFTGLTSAQSFGLFLALLGPLLIATGHTARPVLAVPVAMGGLAAAGLLLNGSRTGLLLFLFLSGLGFLGWFRSTGYGNRAVGGLAVIATVTVVTALGIAVLRGPETGTASRAAEGLLVATGQRDYRDIGTLRWRIGMYAAIGARLVDSGPRERLLGHGLSDTAEIVASGGYYLRGYTFETVDANRVAHNEWLRALYEFGVLGLLLLVLLYAAIFRLGWRVALRHPTAEAAVLFGIVLFLFGLLTTQNVFAASLGPHGLILSFSVARLMCLQTSRDMLVHAQRAVARQGLAALLVGGGRLTPRYD